MKKLLIALLLLLVALPIVIADEQNATQNETGINNETQEEVKIMNTSYGAQVRLLQLEKAITRNIVRGQAIIDALNETKNTTELKSILSEMELLKAEVQQANASAENATQIFVDLKADAIDLSKQFRDILRALVTPGEMDDLRRKIHGIENEALEQLKERIRAKIRQYNAEQLRRTFEILGIDNNELLQKVLNGTATKSDIKEAVKNALKSMTKEERKDAVSELKEAGIKKNVFSRAIIEKAKLNQLVRKEQRLVERLSKLNETSNEKLGQKVKARVSERITERIEEVQQKQLQILEKAQEKIGKAAEKRRGGGDEE